MSLKKFIEGYLALPTALALSMAMLSLFLFVPAECFTEILLSLLFWLAMMAVIIVIKNMFTTVEVAETVATDNRSWLGTHAAYTVEYAQLAGMWTTASYGAVAANPKSPNVDVLEHDVTALAGHQKDESVCQEH